MAIENDQHKENYDYVALQFQLLRNTIDIIKPYALAALLRNFSQKEVDINVFENLCCKHPLTQHDNILILIR